jgi:NAD(P)-dependent dehydrogenase (short-subunit alcohol dehydrogenase family)
MNLQGQHVVVIGGTAGIGLAVARGAQRAGARVTVASRRPGSVEAALRDLGPDAAGRVADVLDADSVDALFEATGPVDHLVYTAGEPLSMQTMAELDLDRARAFFDGRYFGALNAVRAALPRLQSGGSITLTSGSAAWRPAAGWALGASVCGAVSSLMRALAVELAPLRVNAVAPGVLRSGVWAELSEADREAMYGHQGATLPAGRVGEVEDAADAYLYCMAQTHTTGTVLHIDGGALLV